MMRYTLTKPAGIDNPDYWISFDYKYPAYEAIPLLVAELNDALEKFNIKIACELVEEAEEFHYDIDVREGKERR